MINAAIFDLDNCLAAAREVGDDLFAPAFAAIRAANQGQVSEDKLQEAFEACWKHPLDWVATRFQFSPEMLAAGWRLFSNLEVRYPLNGYGDLGVLPELPLQRFLVTSGFRRLQESKIKMLRLQPWFTAIHIDAIDEPNRQGKQRLFEDILKAHQLTPAETLIVGDNPDSEIEAGNRLGMPTVQILRTGVDRTNSASYYIRDLAGLKELLTKLA